MAETIHTKLAPQSKQIVPLLEELTYFLEQYHFSPSILSQNIKALAKQLNGTGLRDDDLYRSGEVPRASNSPTSGPEYDYDTLGMIIAEAHSFGLSLRLGLSSMAWLSAVSSINGAVLTWLTELYRIPSRLSATFADDLRLARQSVLRTALETHFPSFPTRGFRAFGDSNPVVLSTHHVSWVSTLVSDIGLPQDCVRVGPNTLNDLAPNDVVVAVVWVLPDPTEPITWSETQTDALISFVQRTGAWLHAEGYDTVLMTSLPDSESNVVAQIADSVVVDASELLQIERFPSHVMFYRSVARTPPWSINSPTDLSLSVPEIHVEMPSSDRLHLELWFAIQLKGHAFLSRLVALSNSLCDQLYRRIGASSTIRILESSDKANTMLHIRYELQMPAVQSSALNSLSTDVAVDNTTEGEASSQATPTSATLFHSVPVDNEKVTEFLFRYVQNSSPAPLPLQLKRLNADGNLYILWDPLRCYHLHHLARGHIGSFADMILQQSSIITANLKCREVFEKLVQSHPSLVLQNVSPIDYVGLGAVRYRPELVSALEEEVGKQAQRWTSIIDELNLSILNELLQIHPLYYAASSTTGGKCIGLHLDSSEMTTEKVQYHVQLILETAARIEGEVRFLDRLGDLVKEGIKEAQDSIQRSKQQRTAEKGIVRALPLVGRVWNWWSPYKASVDGTNFDLLSESTNNPH